MTVEIKTEPEGPRAGDEVTFVATITDDRAGEAWLVEGSYGDGTAPKLDTRGCEETAMAYGPWTPPEPERTVTVVRVRHTYDEAGTFYVWLHYTNSDCHPSGKLHPFRSEKTARYYVDVAPQPEA